ncbi:hypothetical protein GGH19_002909 [Coemansia sp. RSA 1807]|nr:hypothetical protein GGH19_002909 [Coemansia sp. RSA 1807]
MATLSAGGPSPEPAGTTPEARPSRLLRYRRWLNLHNEVASHNTSCPERYDANIGLASPPSITGDLTAAGDLPAAVDGEASGDIYQQTGAPLVQLMNGRWSGCLGPTVSNRSLSSRQGLRARASVLAASRYCSRPVTAATHMAAANANGAHSRVPSCSAAEITPIVADIMESDDESSQAGVDMPLSPMSMSETETHNEPAAHEQTPPCGSWGCASCAGVTASELPGSGVHAVLPLPERPATPGLESVSESTVEERHEPMFINSESTVMHQALPVRRGSFEAEDEPSAHPHQRRYHALSEDYLEDSAYAEYATESFATDSVHEYGHSRGAGLATHVQAVGGSVMQMDAPGSMDSRSAIMHDVTAAQAGGVGAPNATAIAQIFLVGQPDQNRRVGKHMSRVRRASRRALLKLSRALRVGSSRLIWPSLVEGDQECLSILLESFSAEASLASTIQILENTRNTRSPSFRMRADRVHVSQAQLLLCMYRLFTQLVSSAGQRSRHYRFYLPEDDQMELDRGFSESVLFAAQALAKGFQIRGTESHTEALREPAWMLCSVWAAVRFVLFARGGALWHAWTHGNSAELFSESTDSDGSPLRDEIGALRRVLEDFDEAWVRFERDLCFAYFGLNNSQVAGIMDPGDSSDSGHIAQEEEFSLLVVLLSETLQRCLVQGLVSEEQMETMDPQLILALPRLAILHAIAGDDGGIDGLCFVESEGNPVFWWFREYADVCRQIHDVVSTWPSVMYELLQRMLIAEEADVVLAQTDDAVLSAALFKDKVAKQTPPKLLIRARSETVRDDTSSAKRTAVVDLESIIDSPRSARSLSIDDCISSFCTSTYMGPYEPCFAHSGQSRMHASSSSCLACESSARLYGVSNALPGMFDIPPLPPHPSSTLLATSAEMSASLLTSPSLNNTKTTLARVLSPSLSMASTRSASEERQRKMRLDASRKQLKQAFVSVCTVADSLHSGPFARPFRVALELVFRMNATE